MAQLFAGRNFDIDAAQARLAELMAEEGLPYSDRRMTYNSRLAQELAKWAETQPDGEMIHNALYRAYFVDGLNLAKTDVLLDIVRQIGLPDGDARSALENRSFKAAVDADWQRSRELGVTAVPTFVAGGRALVGAHPYAALEQLVQEAGAVKRA